MDVVKPPIHHINRMLISLSRVIQVGLFSTLVILDGRFLLPHSPISYKTIISNWCIPEWFFTSTLPLTLETHFHLLALCGICLEFLVMAIKWGFNVRNKLLPLLFTSAAAATAANIFGQNGSRSDVGQIRRRLLQLIFEILALVVCSGDLVTMISPKVDKVPNKKILENGSAHSSPSSTVSSSDRISLSPKAATIQYVRQMNGHSLGSPKSRRQRRDSASPGRVGVMLGALSLGQSESDIRSKKTTSKSPVLIPARFQPSPSLFTSLSSMRYGSATSHNEQSYLWPSRFGTTNHTVASENDDAASVFTSISQRVSRSQSIVKNGGSNCSHFKQVSLDWFWKTIICLVMVFSTTTNVVVLYFLLTRS